MRTWGPFARHPLVAVLAAGVLIAGCSGESGTGPDPSPQSIPGELSVTVVPTAGSVGALVLHLTGPSMSSPAGQTGTRVFHNLSGSTLRAVVVGNSLSGDVLRFSVPDVRAAADYSVTVQQAADNDNEPLAPTTLTVQVTATP